MAHLPRELFISLVMDSASDWTVVRNSIVEFIRNIATHHAAKPRISYILYSAADTRPSPIDSSIFFCKGDEAHLAIRSLQAAPRNYIRGRLGSAVLEGIVRSIEFFDQTIEEGSSPDSSKYMVLVANNPPDESKGPIHNDSVEMDNMDWEGLDGALKKRHIHPCFFLPRSASLDKIAELAKRCGAEKAAADVNNIYEIFVSSPKSQPPAVTPTHQPTPAPHDSPPPKRKREETSPVPSSKVRKPNPPIIKNERLPDLKSSPPKPPVPVPVPVPAPAIPVAPPGPIFAQPPQPTVPPSDGIATMEQYQEKLEAIKLKLSSMPRDRLQQRLGHFRTTLHGLDASINAGRVHPDRVTQHRLDRQILADVLKWSVERLESNPPSVPSAPASATPTAAPTSSAPTLPQPSARTSQPTQSQPPQPALYSSTAAAPGPSLPNPPTNVPVNQAATSQTIWQGCVHLIGGRKSGDAGEPVSLLAYCTAKRAKGQLIPVPFSDRMNVITARQDVESKAVVDWLSHLDRAPDNIVYLIDGTPPPEISGSPSYVPFAAVRSIFEEYKLVGIGKLPDQDGIQPASTVVLFGVPAFQNNEVLGAAIFLNQEANLDSLRTGRPIVNGPEIIERAKMQGQLMTRPPIANPFNHLAAPRNPGLASTPGLGQVPLGVSQLMGGGAQPHNPMNPRLLNPNAAAIIAKLRASGVPSNIPPNLMGTFLASGGVFPPAGGQPAPTNANLGLMNGNPNPNPAVNTPSGFSVGPHSLSLLDAQQILTGLREGRISRDNLRPEVIAFLQSRGAVQRNQMAANGMDGNMGALGGGASGPGMGGMGGMNGFGGMGGFGSV